MRRALLAAPLWWGAAAGAQDVVVRDAGPGASAAIVRRVAASPHVLRAGTAPLVFPRDTTVSSSLLVLQRPTYLAGRVQGDVVVVGADLFLRPGADVSGRAVAIGGTVVPSLLGRVAGGTESIRDETFAVELVNGQYLLDYRSLRVAESDPLIAPAGIFGFKVPRYDRVQGLSVPVGLVLQLHDHAVEIEPTIAYRSRRGVVEPAIELRTREEAATRLVVRGARDVRSNESWIYTDLINSLTTFWAGSDTRNYFRSDLGEAHVIHRLETSQFTLEPYVGGRYEYVRSITAVGNVWSVFGRNDPVRMARPNPLVEPGHLGSVLAGAQLRTDGFATSYVSADVEQSLRVPQSTSSFTQVTLHGEIELPSFHTHTMRFTGHGVGTFGENVPRARYAYLGGAGTLRTLDLLEQGGTALFYFESRYLVPVERIKLPLVGTPIVTLRDAFGSAGVKSLPSFQHEVGVGVGASVLRVEYTRAVAGRIEDQWGVGISLSKF